MRIFSFVKKRKMDLRIEQIFYEEMSGDTSFQEKVSIFWDKKFSRAEMRETWNTGIKHGIEIGLRRASLQGQQIEVSENTTNERHREFLMKLYQLSEEYKCALQYHPRVGIVVIAC